MTVHLPPEPKKPPHPFWLMLLYLPFGAAGGYFIVTLGFLLPKSGVTVLEVSALTALVVFPNTWKVLWAPVVDTTLTARAWYVIAAVSTALILLAAAFIPPTKESLSLLGMMALASSISSSVCAMSAERLMAHTTPDHLRGRAGGWSQAGNLGGQGFGGGIALWLAQNVTGWSAGAFLAIGTLLCALALLPFEEPKTEGRLNYRKALVELGKDVWTISISRVGFLTMLLFILPIGTGAASNLWSAMAGEWHANGDAVAVVNGLLNGVFSMLGCLVGGYLCDLIDRKTGYALFGVLCAGCTIAMAEAPRTVETYAIFVLAYAFIVGFAYAAFCAVTLETIGKGAAATKYNVLACISNVPIWYMTQFDGWVHDNCPWGAPATLQCPGNGSYLMLYAESLAAIFAIIFFALLALATRSRPKPAPA